MPKKYKNGFDEGLFKERGPDSMAVTSDEVFKWAGVDGARWRRLEGASLIHDNYGECKISEVADDKIYFGSLSHRSRFEVIPRLATFTRVPGDLSEQIVQDIEADLRERGRLRRENKVKRSAEARETRQQHELLIQQNQNKQEGRQRIPKEFRAQDRHEIFETHKKQRPDIKEIIDIQQVKSLFHFTRFENIQEIISSGITPRKELDQQGKDYISNDNVRLDGFPDASSVSISFPNYQLFFTFRNTKYPGNRWAVFELLPDVLWEFTCLFSQENAATNAAKTLVASERATANALKKMFDDYQGTTKEGEPYLIKRKDVPIPLSFTTNPQAEVLVLDVIPPKFIKKIHVQTLDELSQLKQGTVKCPKNIEMVFKKDYFKRRKDWQIWQSGADPVYTVGTELDDEIPF
jgi:hypothetical protein